MSLLIVYDGECPFCRHYIRRLKLEEKFGPATLIDVRGDDSRLPALWQDGYDLDQGMVAIVDGRIFHGAAALTLLSALPLWLARIVYPAFKAARRFALWRKGVPPAVALK